MKLDWKHGASALVLALGCTPAWGQTAASPPQREQSKASEDTTVNEIVVTAQRREQRLQDVGIAVAAFSGVELRAGGVDNSLEIARLTPGVYISGSIAGQNSQFTIRGVTQNDFNDAIEAPVAVYVDDGYIPNLQGQTFGLFDIKRVEVLKGPQGTLFGRNATGGLVNYIINTPSNTPEGTISVGYGRFKNANVDAAVGGPITDTVSARASLYYNRFDPIWKNVYPQGAAGGVPINAGQAVSPCCQDEGNENTLAGRLQLQYKPNSRLTVRLVGAYARQHLSTAPYTNRGVTPVFDAQGRLVNVVDSSSGADAFGFVQPSVQKLLISKDYALTDRNRTESFNASLHINYDLGSSQLFSITDYKRLTKDFVMDVDASPTNLVAFGTRAKTVSLSQEVRLEGSSARFNWVTGLYYLHIDSPVVDGFIAPRGSLFAALFGLPTQGIDLFNQFRLRTNSISGFGQVEYKFAPRFTFVLGGRIIRESQHYNFASTAFADPNDYIISTAMPLFTLQPSFTDQRSETLWAGKAQVEFRPTSEFLLYLGINRGVKGGAYNAKLPDGSAPLLPSQIPYRPEALTAYEGGFKSTLLNGIATFNASAYYYNYHDYQAFTFQNVSGTVQNRDARTYGAEADLSIRPFEGLFIDISGSAFNAKVKHVQIAPGLFRDVKPTFAPENQVAVQMSYRIPARIAGGAVTMGGDMSYSASFYGNIRNFEADKLPNYTLFNARISWTDVTKHFTLTGYIKNIGDVRYRMISYDLATLCGCNEESYGAPRWYGVIASYTF